VRGIRIAHIEVVHGCGGTAIFQSLAEHQGRIADAVLRVHHTTIPIAVYCLLRGTERVLQKGHEAFGIMNKVIRVHVVMSCGDLRIGHGALH